MLFRSPHAEPSCRLVTFSSHCSFETSLEEMRPSRRRITSMADLIIGAYSSLSVRPVDDPPIDDILEVCCSWYVDVLLLMSLVVGVGVDGGCVVAAAAGAVEAVGVAARGREFAYWAVRSGSVDMVRPAQPLVGGMRTERPRACRTVGRMSGCGSPTAGEEGRVVAGNLT